MVGSLYDVRMRRNRRRRPAGHAQVPVVVTPVEALARVVEPAVLRLAPDRTVLDRPWGLFPYSISTVWRDARSGWQRAQWPLASCDARPVAPLDLHVGHVLEVVAPTAGGSWTQYAWVADVDRQRVVVVPAMSRAAAVDAARFAVDTWRRAELAEVAEAWSSRAAASDARARFRR